jgi:hypothetical protein
MPQELFWSYIAHVKHTTKEILSFQDDLTNRGFPCLRSNQVDENYNNPRELSISRLESLNPSMNKWFFFFIEQSCNDAIALIEFGYALYKTEHVCVIGRSRTNSFMFCTPRVQYFESIDNFFTRHFLP